MLKFESWPPEPGTVTFTGQSKELFRIAGWNNRASNQCESIGIFAADLLIAHCDETKARTIISELTTQAADILPFYDPSLPKKGAFAFEQAAFASLESRITESRAVLSPAQDN